MGEPQPANTLTVFTGQGSQQMEGPQQGDTLTVFFSKDTLQINQVTLLYAEVFF